MDRVVQFVGLGIGWSLVGWVMLQASAFTWRTLQRRRELRRTYATELAAFRQRVQNTARAARAERAIPDWSGWRQFRVAAVIDEARAVKSFYLTPADGQPLADFLPGQYLTFRLPVVTSAAPLVRCYSISDRPRQDFFRTTIKRIGKGSNYLHEHVRIGDMLEVRAPAGTFYVEPLATQPIVLLGAGIGVTPLVSMLEALAHANPRREVYALFGFRNGQDHPFKDRLSRLVEANPQIHLQISYSAPTEKDVHYRDYHHRGRVTIEHVRSVLPSSNFHYYLCGPAAMMESLVPALWAWGVPESHVHFEAFGPASVKRPSTAATTAPSAVRFDRSSKDVEWNGSCSSLLELGEASGITLISGCRAGSCGECLTKICSGHVATNKQPGITVPPDHCLTCISTPVGELVLDA